MREVKKKLLLCLLVCLLNSVSSPASANIEGLLPTEQEMGYTVAPNGLLYKEYPTENYGWDTSHEWFVMEGLNPKTGNSKELVGKSITDPWMALNVSLNRLSIAFLQLGFNNPLAEGVISGLNTALRPIKTYFFNQVFWLIALVVAWLITLKYAEGRKGETFMILVKAIFYPAIIFAVIDNIEWILFTLVGLADYLALAVIGTMNFAPLMGADANTLAGTKIIEISNLIFKTYIQDTWLFGQFGSIKEIPLITAEELQFLTTNNIVANVNQIWSDVMLQYPSGSEERKAIVDILIDPSVFHSANLDTTMFVNGAETRITLALLSSLLNISGFILYLITGCIQLLSSLGLLLLTGSLPILVIFSFFGDMGERFLKQAASYWIFAASLKIAAAIFIGIPMMVMTVINFDSMWYLLNVGIHIIINVLGIWFLPHIWKTIAPGLIKGAVRVSSMIGNAKNRLMSSTAAATRRYRTSPQKTRSEFRRGNFREGEDRQISNNGSRRKGERAVSSTGDEPTVTSGATTQGRGRTSAADQQESLRRMVVKRVAERNPDGTYGIHSLRRKMEDDDWKKFHVKQSQRLRDELTNSQENLNERNLENQQQLKLREILDQKAERRRLERQLKRLERKGQQVEPEIRPPQRRTD